MTNPIGRPRIYTEQEDPLQIKSVRLSNWHIRLAKKLGNGSLSEGIRLALESMKLMREKAQ